MDFIFANTAPVESMTFTFEDGRALYMTDICDPSLSRFFVIFNWATDELRFVHLTSSEPFLAFFSPSAIYEGYIPLRVTEDVLRMTEEEIIAYADHVYELVHAELNQMVHIAFWDQKHVVWCLHQLDSDTACGYDVIDHETVMIEHYVECPCKVDRYSVYPVSEELRACLDILPAGIKMSVEARLLNAIYFGAL